MLRCTKRYPGYLARARQLRNMTGTHGLSWKSLLHIIPMLACIFKVRILPSAVVDAGAVSIKYRHSALETAVYNRQKDLDSVTGDWFAELLSHDAWFKDTLPNVCPHFLLFIFCTKPKTSSRALQRMISL